MESLLRARDFVPVLPHLSPLRQYIIIPCYQCFACKATFSLFALISYLQKSRRSQRRVKSEEVKSKNPFRKNANGIFGGEWGIRTLVGVSPNGFQDRLVMTTSITLHIKKVPKWVLFGAEGGIWTLARFLHAYSLSRGAPSASWVLLHDAAEI